MSASNPLNVYYDGTCRVCRTEMNIYKKRADSKMLNFVDISATDFVAEEHGRTQDEFMQQLHVRDNQGRFFTGVDAFIQIWNACPEQSVYRLLGRTAGLPGIHTAARGGYALFARFRHLLPKTGPACDDGSCRL